MQPLQMLRSINRAVPAAAVISNNLHQAQAVAAVMFHQQLPTVIVMQEEMVAAARTIQLL